MDNLVFLPEKCLDDISTRLEQCYRGTLERILYGFEKLKMMDYSISGQHTVHYARCGLNTLMDNIKNQVGFENFNNVRNAYFAELFKFSEMYREMYNIQDMYGIEELQQNLGEVLFEMKQ